MRTELLSSADGTRVALHDLGGAPGAPPVLFCHGNGLVGTMWLPVVEALGDHIRPFLLDFRGHGASDNQPTLDVHWDRFVEDLAAAAERIRELTDTSALFGVGHSLGGAILLRLEATRPGTFAGLTVFEPIVFPPDVFPPSDPHPIADLARKRRMEFDSVDEIVDRFGRRPPFDRCVPAALRAYVESGTRSLPDGRVRLACDGSVEARIFEADRVDTWSRLDRVTVPVTVLAGTTVDNRPSEMADPVAEVLSNATFTRHEQLTHMGPMEDPALLADAVASMVRPSDH